MNNPTFEQLQTAVERCGFRWFNRGDYNINIVGVRSHDARSNRFNDYLCVAFYMAGEPHLYCFEATTDPGVYWRKNPMHIDGSAIVKPGQYPSLWQLGLHQGKYRALVQRGPVTVYRDNNRDTVVDAKGTEQTGLFGINLHRAAEAGKSDRVGKWSAGCQVIACSVDYQLLLALCSQAAKRYGNGFTYTLLTEAQLWTQ